jgi:hypothetical protein
MMEKAAATKGSDTTPGAESGGRRAAAGPAEKEPAAPPHEVDVAEEVSATDRDRPVEERSGRRAVRKPVAVEAEEV